MNFADPVSSRNLILLAVVAGLIAGLVSAFHHWYGAVEYNTPWRLWVSYWILGIALIVYSLLYLYWVNIGNLVGKLSIWLFFSSAVVFQAGFLLFECVYSHVLKNILFFSGTPLSILNIFYPSPAYHLPDNMLFELTGLLQLIGFIAVWFAIRVFRDRPWS